MKHYIKAAILVVALGLGACTNPDHLGTSGGGNGVGNGAGNGAGIDNNGIVPGSANDPTSAAYFQQTVGDRVLFVVDSSSLTPEGRSTLASQANWLKANTSFAAIIEGHADEQGTGAYNLALGAKRATAAQEFLISQGIAAGRLRTLSYGKERPLEICSDETCYTKNRRAVTVISVGAGT